MKKIADTAFLQKKRNEVELLVADAIYLENLEAKGKSNEDVKNEAKALLGLAPEDNLTMEAEEAAKKQNIEVQAFISLARAIADLEGSDLTAKVDMKGMKAALDEVAEKLAKRFDVDVERLYEEE